MLGKSKREAVVFIGGSAARTVRLAVAVVIASVLTALAARSSRSWGSSSAAPFPVAPLQDAPIFLPTKLAARLLAAKPGPKYPPLAKQNYIQGRVRIRILVNQEGKVAEAHVLSGHPFLAAAALVTLSGWAYLPYQSADGPRPFVTDVQMIFALKIKDLSTFPSAPEEDLRRQVRPPRIVSRPDGLPQASSIRIRVLVSAEGKALDVDPAPGFPSNFKDMRERLASWTFQPAHFGSLAVPWYLDVEVPSADWPQAPAGAG